MTKLIRIENADTSKWKVVVEVWQKRTELEGGKDVKIREVELDYPASMMTEHIWDNQYLIIRENGERKD